MYLMAPGPSKQQAHIRTVELKDNSYILFHTSELPLDTRAAVTRAAVTRIVVSRIVDGYLHRSYSHPRCLYTSSRCLWRD